MFPAFVLKTKSPLGSTFMTATPEFFVFQTHLGMAAIQRSGGRLKQHLWIVWKIYRIIQMQHSHMLLVQIPRIVSLILLSSVCSICLIGEQHLKVFLFWFWSVSVSWCVKFNRNISYPLCRDKRLKKCQISIDGKQVTHISISKNTSSKWKYLFLCFCPVLCSHVGVVHPTRRPFWVLCALNFSTVEKYQSI